MSDAELGVLAFFIGIIVGIAVSVYAVIKIDSSIGPKF